MDNTTLLALIGGILILGFLIVAIVIRFKTKPSIYDKESAQNFLLGLSESFYEKVTDIINNINISDYDSIEDFEVSVLSTIYEGISGYISEELEKTSKEDILSAMALKILNKDFIIKFIDEFVKENDIEDKISNIWFDNFKSKSEEVVENDEKLSIELSDEEKYIENVTEEDMIPAQEVVPSEEELASLNPPSDEEKEYDPENDSSVEIIEDDTYLDTRGRKRSKKTGRYV